MLGAGLQGQQMANCPNEDKDPANNGRCCDYCAAGQYLKAHCDNTKATECAECGRGFYTATKNYMTKCQICRNCNSSNKQKKVKDCTAQEDTVCECVNGYYCSNDDCDHCVRVTYCPVGKGVKVQATRTNDIICAPCEDGTYSNVTDFHSPCQTQTRCKDLGRELKTPGTSTTDTICGNFKSHCTWILPAGLWSGLVLTALVLLFGLICWRAKRKSYKAVKKETTSFLQPPFKSTGAGPVTLVEMVPVAPVTRLDLPLLFTELNGHCQESCTVECCKLSLFNPADDNVVTQDSVDSVDSSHPITPLKVSVSFAESNHITGSAGYGTANFRRTYSEPQEDEWCGT
ncbi:tumor necrosis factor receptor superfamily member 5 [Sebastes umbrosus]|uniref:tumor necrosis factor receptor superfamily member 5 n=1 Tax=Sebastes umbrosus TaxID=72105 RepID=UPI00189D5DD0|nr:tumor necrosis factor receptor superfamily member 5 [Sebastes umbrosus]